MASKKKLAKWDAEQVRRVAGKSLVDPRTIQRWLRGEIVRASSAARIEQAAKQLGVPV